MSFSQTAQKALLWTYARGQDSGLLDQPWVQAPFLSLYSLYKRHLEDPFARLMKEQPSLFQHGAILDIGANIGYTAMLFSEGLSEGNKVYAFEPEARNLRFLGRAVKRRRLGSRIIIVPMAVGASSGSVRLWVNPGTHADHRILTEAFRPPASALPVQDVPLTSVDEFVSHRPEISAVAFLKLDVQGFEEAVCHGMARTLLANPEAAIAVEYFPEGMRSLGFEPEAMLRFFEERGYVAHLLSRRSGLGVIDFHKLREKLPAPGYVDLVYSRRKLSSRIL